jgi:hypothetical protein
MITQEGRDTAWQDVTDAIKECKGRGWQHSQLLIDTLEVLLKVYQADLETRFNNDPLFGVEDHAFLSNEIAFVSSFIAGDISLDELSEHHGVNIQFS